MTLSDENGNSVKDIYGNNVAPITTGSNGEYKFCKLDAGKYIVKVTPPSGYIISPKDKGGDDAKDSDIDPNSGKTVVITLNEGENDLTWDAGLYKSACIGDLVWEDIDGNGIQDSGEEPISGVVVTLMDANGNSVKDINGNTVAPQTTGNDGKYKFCNLKPGTYKVKMFKDDPLYYVTYKDKGNDEAKDSDIDDSTYTTDPVTLVSGENNMNVDGGYFRCGSPIGVYSVIKGNRFAANSLAGLKVKVYDKEGNLVSIEETDENGKVKFDTLIPGDYKIEFEKVEGLEFKVLKDEESGEEVEGVIDNQNGVADISVKPEPIKKKSASALNALFALSLIAMLLTLVRKESN